MHRITEAGVNSQIHADVRIWCQRVDELTSQSNPLWNNKNIGHKSLDMVPDTVAFIAALPIFAGGIATNRVRAEIKYLYSDQQTPHGLKIGDVVDVVKWTDGGGNHEWAKVQLNNNVFFYPSNHLLPLR